MANPEHLEILRQGADKWNAWREANPDVVPRLRAADLRKAELSSFNLPANLKGADLSMARLAGANLSWADLSRADLGGANLTWANLSRANLDGTCLRKADLSGANLSVASVRDADLREGGLSGADLSGAYVIGSNLTWANLSWARCSGADFSQATLVSANLENADLTNAQIYGIAAWDLQLDRAVQRDLVITPFYAPSKITVDDVEVAQFIYLLLRNDRIRKVIDSITSKVVLILGRFTPERKAVLDAVRQELRKRGYLPVVFDFEKPSNRDVTETVLTLAHMAKFVIADLTEPRSLPQELATIVPHLRSVPVQPILLASEREWGMYTDLTAYPWVLPIVTYETTDELLANLGERVIGPAERRLAATKASG